MMKIFTEKKTNMKFLTSKVKKKIIENTKQAPILMILPERSKNKDDIKRSKTSLKMQVHSLPWPHLKSDMGVLF